MVYVTSTLTLEQCLAYGDPFSNPSFQRSGYSFADWALVGE